MNKYLCLTISVSLMTANAAAQTDTIWTRTFGGTGWDEAASVQATIDGGLVLVGVTLSFGEGGGDVYLIRTDASGDTLWTRTYGGANWDQGNSVQATSDGGFILVGLTSSFGSGNFDVYLIRTDANGDTVWTRTYGGSGPETGYSVQQTTDGGFIVVGDTAPQNGLETDVFLIRVDASGEIVWSNTYGGDHWERGYSVQQTSDGGFAVAGQRLSFNNADNVDDVYLLRTNMNGTTLWARTYGGNDHDKARSVQVTPDGGFVLSGYSDSFGTGSDDMYLLRMDENGDVLWMRTYGGNRAERAFSAQIMPDGGFVLAGYREPFIPLYRDAWLIRTDANGDTLWTRTFGGANNDEAHSIHVTADGGFVLAGYTQSFGAGSADAWLIRLEPESNLATIEAAALPTYITLHRNYPNPFNPTTTLNYELSKASKIDFRIYNLSGLEVIRLVNEDQTPGYYGTIWSGRDAGGRFVPSGIYIARLNAQGYTNSIKMVLLK